MAAATAGYGKEAVTATTTIMAAMTATTEQVVGSGNSNYKLWAAVTATASG